MSIIKCVYAFIIKLYITFITMSNIYIIKCLNSLLLEALFEIIEKTHAADSSAFLRVFLYLL